MSFEIERKFLVCREFGKKTTEVTDIELARAEVAFETPPWLGEEASFAPSYYNPAMAVKPYKSW